MTPNDYQKLALRTEKTPPFLRPIVSYVPPAGPGHREIDEAFDKAEKVAHQKARLLHASIGLCTEVGELQDALKKHLIYGKPLDDVNVMEEAGDLLWYIALALDASGFTMEQAMERNIEKLRARFPTGFTEEKALVRDLGVERKALEK